MPMSEVLAEMLGSQSGQLAETAVQGIGTLLGGLDAIINPQVTIPPMIGMASSDFMQLGLGAIMASTNANLVYAKQQALKENIVDDELLALIKQAETSRQQCALQFGARARAMNKRAISAEPTKDEVETFYTAIKKVVAMQNVQRAQLRLYRDKVGSSANFDFRGLLKKIIKGADTIFNFVNKAKTVYDKAKPYLEKI